jgi:hypothetical protein
MGNPSINKRQKERDRKDRQRDKEAKRRERRDDKAKRPDGPEGVDPDIAGIIPGPQPLPEEESA